jgi:hypothetical protein
MNSRIGMDPRIDNFRNEITGRAAPFKNTSIQEALKESPLKF